MIALTANSLYTPLECIDRPVLLMEDGLIADVYSASERPLPSNCRQVDFPGATLAPGFLDIHIHGGSGYDVMDASPDALPSVERLLASHGVTGYFPTTVTSALDKLLAALERLASAIENPKENGIASYDAPRARPLGIHLEGPFISQICRGVHPPQDILPPTLALFDRFWQAARGHISIMTIAPELDGAAEVISEAARRGVCVSLGHSNAQMGEAQSAVAAGARHATHTFNAMRPLNHRDPGIIGLVLTDSRLSADIIVDGIHLDPAIVKMFFELKGPDRAVLITDAISATGMPDGRYRLGSFDVEVAAGKCTAGGKLAGSVLTMDRAVRNVMQFADIGLDLALRTATLNPASVVGQSQRGRLAPGARADVVVLNSQQEVMRTIVGGQGL